MKLRNDIIKFVKDELIGDEEQSELSDQTNLIDTGIVDSMGIMKLLTYLEDQFSITLNTDELMPENFESIDRICSLLEAKVS